MMQQLVNGMNESKRPFLIDVLVTRNTEVFGQVNNCDGMSEVGSLRRIRGKITTSDVTLTTTEQHGGLSKETDSQNGKNHRLIVFFGFMESVCTAFS
jgi:hypothetical protein